MKQEWIKIIKDSQKLKLSFIDSLTHYMIVIFLLIVPTISIWELIELYIFDSYTVIEKPWEMFKTTSPLGIAAVIFYLNEVSQVIIS
ncbi:hypothetical protein DMA11_16280 [Marinilabiliaceae bacterium JC017]|nr:hypothetical protein DMA11_16280 [Marinilabiliaceae bacterium JC017]